MASQKIDCSFVFWSGRLAKWLHRFPYSRIPATHFGLDCHTSDKVLDVHQYYPNSNAQLCTARNVGKYQGPIVDYVATI